MSTMATVRMVSGPGRETTGETLTVSSVLAARWVAEGVAEYAEPPAPETAMLDVGRAERPKGRGRGVERR